MVISVPGGQKVECFAAVDRAKCTCIQKINRIRRFRICVNFAEVPGALPKTAIFIYATPMFSRIVGAVEPALLRFDDSVDAIWICTGNSHPYFAQNSVRQTIALKMLPSNTIVLRSV